MMQSRDKERKLMDGAGGKVGILGHRSPWAERYGGVQQLTGWVLQEFRGKAIKMGGSQEPDCPLALYPAEDSEPLIDLRAICLKKAWAAR